MKPSIVSISIEKPLAEEARKLAKARRQSLSGYICTLIELDLQSEDPKKLPRGRKLAAA